MDWVLANWFWILVFVLFIAMHLFGHGGHGGHSGHGGHRNTDKEENEAQSRVANKSSGEHQH